MTKALATGATAQARARVLASVSLEKNSTTITSNSIVNIIQKNKSLEIKSDKEGKIQLPKGQIEIIF